MSAIDFDTHPLKKLSIQELESLLSKAIKDALGVDIYCWIKSMDYGNNQLNGVDVSLHFSSPTVPDLIDTLFSPKETK